MAKLKKLFKNDDLLSSDFSTNDQIKIMILSGDSNSIFKDVYCETLNSQIHYYRIDIDLSYFDSTVSLNSFSGHVLKLIEEKSVEGKILLVLTGLLGEKSMDWLAQWVEENAALLNWDKVKVVVISRRCDLFLQQEDYLESFIPIVNKEIKHDWLEELQRNPLNILEIQEIIHRYVKTVSSEISVDDYLKYLNRIPGMKDVLSHEVFLKIYLEQFGLWLVKLRKHGVELKEGEDVKQVCVKFLCRELLMEWYRLVADEISGGVEAKKLELVNAYHELSEELAGAISEFGIDVKGFTRAQMLDCISRGKDPAYVLKCMRGVPLQLREDQSGQFEFRFQGDLLFNYLKNEYQLRTKKTKGKEANLKLFKAPLTIVENKQEEDWINDDMNLRELSNEEMEYQAEQLKKNDKIADELRNRLLAWIYRSRRGEVYSVGARNAISILNYGHYSFSGMDLSRIRVPKAYLEGGIFHQTLFIQAVLSRASFYNSYVVDADFIGAKLDGTYFGNIRKNSERVASSFCHDFKRNRLLVGINDGGILGIVSDNDDWEQQFLITLHRGKVRKLLLSAKDDYLYSWSIDNTICKWSLRQNSIELVKQFQVNNEMFRDLFIHPASGQLYAYDQFGRILVFSESLVGFQEIYKIAPDSSIIIEGHPLNANLIAFIVNSRRLILFHLNNKSPVEIALPESIVSLKISETWKYIICISDKGVAYYAYTEDSIAKYSNFKVITDKITSKEKNIVVYKDQYVIFQDHGESADIYWFKNENSVLPFGDLQEGVPSKFLEYYFQVEYNKLFVYYCTKRELICFSLYRLRHATPDSSEYHSNSWKTSRRHFQASFSGAEKPDRFPFNLILETGYYVQDCIKHPKGYVVLYFSPSSRSVGVKILQGLQLLAKTDMMVLDARGVETTILFPDGKIVVRYNAVYGGMRGEDNIALYSPDDNYRKAIANFDIKKNITATESYQDNYVACGCYDGSLYILDISKVENIRCLKVPQNKKITLILEDKTRKNSQLIVVTEYTLAFYIYLDVLNADNMIMLELEHQNFEKSSWIRFFECDFLNKRIVMVVKDALGTGVYAFSYDHIDNIKITPRLLFRTEIGVLAIQFIQNDRIMVGDDWGNIYTCQFDGTGLEKFSAQGNAIVKILNLENENILSLGHETEVVSIMNVNKNKRPLMHAQYGRLFTNISRAKISSNAELSPEEKTMLSKRGAQLVQSIKGK